MEPAARTNKNMTHAALLRLRHSIGLKCKRERGTSDKEAHTSAFGSVRHLSLLLEERCVRDSCYTTIHLHVSSRPSSRLIIIIISHEDFELVD
ncbi:hypothetical protein EVAR_73821_1 [Eumeta japonica]|uniref:Uncharacterized protein n=1 Tax=Eumeta variegata TaxID=151549 RepID=A0A4C1SIU9_EUMVA|nr:hypothetical protein EVAR_73821_1 [Eumeta japonica]